MKNYEYAIIFDVDGTLIDVKQSYNQVILFTSYFYVENVLGFEYLPHINKWFTKSHIRDLKGIEGFNNDFTCTSALILFFLEMIKPHQIALNTIPLLSEESSKVTFPKIKTLNNEWKKFLSCFKDKPKLPPEILIKKSVLSSYIKNTGEIRDKNYLERIFQEIYYGERMFKKYYKIDSIFSKEVFGLYKKETLLISLDILDQIKMMEIPVAIFTGRPKLDLDLILDHFLLNKYFDQKYIITLTDCLKEEKIRKDGEIFTKPNPWGINQLKKLLPSCNRYILIGDSPDDILSAFNANINVIVYGDNKTEVKNYPNVIDRMDNWNSLFRILTK